MALLKSGWLWRQTSILKRWKLNWCDLWIDGSLAFYKTERRREFEHRVGLKTSCVSVKSGLECAGLSPPENHPRENLVEVQLRDGTTFAYDPYPPHTDPERPIRWHRRAGGTGATGRNGGRRCYALLPLDALLVLLI
ncbi:unnamed protein product [Coregonus sp. 'balchen']|nr:unnamed protein product [Coregonus sp. 'balchen']